MNIVNIIDNLTITIADSPIGIMMSGGADSALLLYFLLKHSKNKIHIFTLANQQKRITTTHSSLNVVSKCAELTDNYNFVHHITYEKEQNIKNLFKTPGQFLNDSTIAFLYSGVTKNPPACVTDTFSAETTETSQRNPDVIRETLIHNNLFTPWTNIDKQYICKIYNHYDLIDNLYPLTRSCEWAPGWKVEDPGNGHCGRCWWCEERNWGFNKL
jgi:7-cyano-7-deazaguanine synthase in queuosine biosynthesis